MSDGSEISSELEGAPAIANAPAASPAPAGPNAPAVSAVVPLNISQASPAFARPTRPMSGSWWTIPMLCLGIIIIACAMIVEQVEENHQIEWQRNKLQIDLDYFNKQVDINQQFLERLATDANLAERLAQRQMKLVRQGSAVLELTDPNLPEDTSPFRLVNITPPPPVQPYEPARGPLTTIFGNTRLRLYIFGLGLCLMAIGLIVGGSEGKTRGAM